MRLTKQALAARHCSATYSKADIENPVRVVVFNRAEGWSRDVTVDIADELRRRYPEFGEIPESVLEFIEAQGR